MSAGDDFRALVAVKFQDPDPAEVVLLDQVCNLLDEVERMEVRIEQDGVTTTGGNGQLAAHPLLASCREHRKAIGVLVSRLKLEDGTFQARRAKAQARWSA